MYPMLKHHPKTALTTGLLITALTAAIWTGLLDRPQANACTTQAAGQYAVRDVSHRTRIPVPNLTATTRPWSTGTLFARVFDNGEQVAFGTLTCASGAWRWTEPPQT